MADSYTNLQKTGTYSTSYEQKAAADAAAETQRVIKELGESIKTGDFSPAYLLCGPEGYLIRYYKNALKKAIIGDDTMNCTVMTGDGFDLNAFIEIAQTMPFFAERRLIIVENCGIFQAGPGGGTRPEAERLKDFLQQLPDTSCVIFAENSVDRRLALYKFFSKIGRVCTFNYMDQQWISRWLIAKARSEGAVMDQGAASALIERVGVDLNILANETDKLVAYKGGAGQITAQDVGILAVTRLEDRIFDMLTCALRGRMDKAMEMYSDLLGLREAPIKIIVIIGKQCAQILAVKDAEGSGRSDAEVASDAGLSTGRVYYIRQDYRSVSRDRLALGMKLAAEMDEAIKTGALEDRLAVEILLAGLGGSR